MGRDYNAPRTVPRWLLPLLVGVLGFAAIHPFDGPVGAGLMRLGSSLTGDIRRELESWQQFGQGLSLAIIALLIWLLDPPRRRRLLDLGLTLLIAQAVSSGGKMLVGRPHPRPWLNDPRTFLTPWGEYPVPSGNSFKLVHAWERGAAASADLWSMPSSHTLFAAALAVFLTALYPRIRWLLVALTLLVGCSRLLFGAHWPTDVIIGAAAGWLIGRCVVANYAGVRLLDWIWVRVVDRSAAPALPAVLAVEKSRSCSS